MLLETMAGKGTEVGRRSFEELRANPGPVWSCPIMWESAWTPAMCMTRDMILWKTLEGVLEEFDRVIGLDRLKADTYQ